MIVSKQVSKKKVAEDKTVYYAVNKKVIPFIWKDPNILMLKKFTNFNFSEHIKLKCDLKWIHSSLWDGNVWL